MKKTILALAALASLAAAPAFAQVTVYGLVDAGVRGVSTDGAASETGVISNGSLPSRLGFKGSEDLGNGLMANFVLEEAVAPATGAGTAGLAFARESTVGLSGSFGSFKLGRQETASFGNLKVYDPFNAGGIGGVLNTVSSLGGATTQIRTDGLVSYSTPSYGNFKATVQFNGNNVAAGSKYAGLNIQYANGPLAAGLTFGDTTVATGEFKQTTAAVAYDLTSVKLSGIAVYGELAGAYVRTYQIGAKVPFGSGALKAAYSTVDSGSDNSARQLALGYDLDLSKRTTVYSTVSFLKNDSASTRAVGSNASVAGGQSSGIEVGLRHSF